MARPALSTAAEILEPVIRFAPMWAVGCVVALSVVRRQPVHTLSFFELIALKFVPLRRFLVVPTERAVRYSRSGVPLLGGGMAISAFSLRTAAP